MKVVKILSVIGVIGMLTGAFLTAIDKAYDKVAVAIYLHRVENPNRNIIFFYSIQSPDGSIVKSGVLSSVEGKQEEILLEKINNEFPSIVLKRRNRMSSAPDQILYTYTPSGKSNFEVLGVIEDPVSREVTVVIEPH